MWEICPRLTLLSPTDFFILMWSNKVLFLLHFLFLEREGEACQRRKKIVSYYYADTQMQTFREKVQKQQLLSLLFFFLQSVCLGECGAV